MTTLITAAKETTKMAAVCGWIAITTDTRNTPAGDCEQFRLTCNRYLSLFLSVL